MADQRKDDIAAALEAMMRGQSDADPTEAPPVPQPESGGEDEPTPVVPSDPAGHRPAAPHRPPAPPPAAKASASPASTRPAPKAAQPAPSRPAPARPQAPVSQRPGAPLPTPTPRPTGPTPVVPPVDPAVPVATVVTPPADDAAASSGNASASPGRTPASQTVPTTPTGRPLVPTVEAVRGALAPPVVEPKRTGRSLAFRQTIIPPLLTGGVMLLILGILPFVTPADSPFGAMRSRAWIAFFFMAVGVLLLIVAGFNMMAVKQQLAEKQTNDQPSA